MALSEFEKGKIAEIVAGKVGDSLDAKSLRQIVDAVVDSFQAKKGNPDITGVTCEVSANELTTERVPTSQPLPPDEEMISKKGGLYDQIGKTDRHRVIIAAFGTNRPGVVAAIAEVLAELNCSIEDISQTLIQEFFSMITIVNMADSKVDFTGLRDRLKQAEEKLGMKLYVMHEDTFRYMHRI